MDHLARSLKNKGNERLKNDVKERKFVINNEKINQRNSYHNH